jgi:hypothetical protein
MATATTVTLVSSGGAGAQHGGPVVTLGSSGGAQHAKAAPVHLLSVAMDAASHVARREGATMDSDDNWTPVLFDGRYVRSLLRIIPSLPQRAAKQGQTGPQSPRPIRAPGHCSTWHVCLLWARVYLSAWPGSKATFVIMQHTLYRHPRLRLSDATLDCCFRHRLLPWHSRITHPRESSRKMYGPCLPHRLLIMAVRCS